MIKKPDVIVWEMWIGEGLCFLGLELIVLLPWVKDKIGYTFGLLAGVLLAVGAAYHIWWVLEHAMDLNEDAAGKMMGSRYLFRYLALILLILFTYYTQWANPFAVFLGYMSLKLAAYLQPLTHKIRIAFCGSKKVKINQERGE